MYKRPIEPGTARAVRAKRACVLSSLMILFCSIQVPRDGFADQKASSNACLSDCSDNAIPFEEFDNRSVLEVFQNLIEKNNPAVLLPASRLKIEQGRWANAFVRGENEIVVTTQLVQLIKDRSELAFVLAHELSHVALHHKNPTDTNAELAADKLALYLMATAGYNPRSADVVLERLAQPLLASLVSISPRVQALREYSQKAIERPKQG